MLLDGLRYMAGFANRFACSLNGLFRTDSVSLTGESLIYRTAKYIGSKNRSNVKTNGKSFKRKEKHN